MNTLRKAYIIGLVGCCIVSCIICIAVIIAALQKRKKRKILNYLVVNCALATMLVDVLGTIHLIEERKQITGEFMCPFMAYLRNFSMHLLFSSIVAICYGRICVTDHGLANKEPPLKTVLTISGYFWSLSLLVAIPEYVLNQSEQLTTGTREIIAFCSKNTKSTLYPLYFLLRGIVLHLVLSIYLLYGLFRAQSKLAHRCFRELLSVEEVNGIAKQMKTAYMALFGIMVWVMCGLGFIIHGILLRVNSSKSSTDDLIDVFDENFAFVYPVVKVSFIVYIIGAPILLFKEVNGQWSKVVQACFILKSKRSRANFRPRNCIVSEIQTVDKHMEQEMIKSWRRPIEMIVDIENGSDIETSSDGEDLEGSSVIYIPVVVAVNEPPAEDNSKKETTV